MCMPKILVVGPHVKILSRWVHSPMKLLNTWNLPRGFTTVHGKVTPQTLSEIIQLKKFLFNSSSWGVKPK